MKSEGTELADVVARAHLAKCYQEITALGQRIRANLESSIPDIGPYPKHRVVLRLAQRILEMIHLDYLRGRRDALFQPDAEAVTLGGLRMNLRTGAVGPGYRVLLRTVAFFLRAWAFLLLQAPLALRSRRSRSAVTLILGLRQRDFLSAGSAREFLAFCGEGKVAPLAGATTLVVQDRVKAPHCEERLSVGRVGLLEALRRAPRAKLSRFLAEHAAAFAWYVAGTLRRAILCLLDRDFAEYAMAARLSEARGLKDVVVTNTWFAEQPLWVTDLPGRTFGAHLVCYSMLGRAFGYADAPESPPHPGFGLMRADSFWVWTPGQRELLSELGVEGEVHVCGPLVWRVKHRASGRGLQIALFDVTPVRPEVADRLGLAYNYYYSAQNCTAFLTDVVAAARALEARTGRAVRVLLKHKRPFGDVHDKRYIDLVASFCDQDLLRTVEPDVNPYVLLDESFAAVVMPFSSPAYIARDAGVPAIYYDPTGLLLPSFEQAEGIAFARSRDDLGGLLQSGFASRVELQAARTLP